MDVGRSLNPAIDYGCVDGLIKHTALLDLTDCLLCFPFLPFPRTSAALSQIEGAFVQGQGWCTLEETTFLQNGALFTTGPGAYKVRLLPLLAMAVSVPCQDQALRTDACSGILSDPWLCGHSAGHERLASARR